VEVVVELFGGLMVIFWIIGFSLTVIWFILPFVIFSIKGRVDETLSRLEAIEKRIASVEKQLQNRTSD
jgi:threonine/homoserine/homoserine lactone efflux protein